MSDITLLNFVYLTTLLIDKGRHKLYGTFTGVAVVGALRFFKIFI